MDSVQDARPRGSWLLLLWREEMKRQEQEQGHVVPLTADNAGTVPLTARRLPEEPRWVEIAL